MTAAHKLKPLVEMYDPKDIAWGQAIVDGAFDTAHDRFDHRRRNPILGGEFMPEFDSIAVQKEDAVRAVLARLWHTKKYPLAFDLQPLPLNRDERENMQGRGPVGHLVKWYARSLEARGHDVIEHPLFHDFACGMMTDLESWPKFNNVRDRFPPRPLPGLDPKYSYWEPLSETTTAKCRMGGGFE